MWAFFRNVHYSAWPLGKSPSFTLALLLLFQVTPADPVTLVVVPIVFACIAFAACVIPARGAMRLDPTRALLINR
jgi:hypothetical protein